MKRLVVFLVMLGPVCSFARMVGGTDTLPPFRARDFALPRDHFRRDSVGCRRPDRMPCFFPPLTLPERMPVRGSGNADRMPNSCRVPREGRPGADRP